MPSARIGPGGAAATHGPHGMHGFLTGTAAAVILAAAFVTGAEAVEVPTIPTAAAGVAAPRCTLGQFCTFAAPIFACDYAEAERIAVAGPAKGGEVGAGLVRDATCQTVPAGRPLGTEATKSGLVVYLTEGGQHLGYMPVNVFAPPGTAAQADSNRPESDASSQAASPPLRDTARLADIVITANRSPDLSAIDLRGQGTGAATGVFRSGPRERHKFCRDFWSADQAASLRSCLSEPDATITVRANCAAREVSFNGHRYGLFERPRDAAPDIHLDEHRQMLYRDLKSGEWLDGSTVSGEVTVRSALVALCPGVDPEASYGLVYRKDVAVASAEPGSAAGDAEAAVREILARVLSPDPTVKKAGDDRRFLTPGLYALFMKSARDFNGDPYTGSQEPESYRLVSLSSDAWDGAKIVVTARFDIQGLPDAHPRIAYVLVRDADRWRIDDIRYLSDGDTSMRRLLRGPRSSPR